MKQVLIGLIIGIVLGILAFYIYNLTTPSRSQFDTSSKCGQVLPLHYCSSGYWCEVQCNICGCAQPQCHPEPECAP